MKFAEQITKAFRGGIDIGVDIGYQRAFDEWMIALNSPECMGAKGVMGGDKIVGVAKYVVQLDKDFAPAWLTASNCEADVYQDKLDKRLGKFLGDKLLPFKERYKGLLKEIRY